MRVIQPIDLKMYEFFKVVNGHLRINVVSILHITFG
jgi:hypothetical protein